ncbi:peptidoglycan recognition protein family protein [Jiangella muralis]|uniref:peptidoglycan recognition protein family protein n=1 Tax=Jiangella muralis TaxID=702383 RepID=UPI00069D2AF7|nr:peptidoglycan recognition family protein [Jiangella muralis]
MATYRPRSAWTSTAPGGDTLSASAVTRINVHYPASGNVRLQGISDADVARRLRGWRQYHIDGRGWSDIGYSMAIDGHGCIWTLRGLDRVGAHSASDSNPSENRHSHGVLFVIGNDEEPTTAAVNAFRQLRADILKRSPKATLVRGHQQVPGASTECPGDPLMELIRAGALAGNPRPEPDPEDDVTQEQLIAAVRIAVHGLLDEAAKGSTPTGRQVRDDLRAIVKDA